MKELKKKLLSILNYNNNALFLDRDGVINKKIEGGYVTKWEELEFLPGIFDSLKFLSSIFKRIIVVTNQRGVSKGLLTIKELEHIHDKMIKTIVKRGGRIDKIYFCPCDPEINSECKCRKPQLEMAFEAKRDFPEIVFSYSIMVGDSEEDIMFGKNLKMFTVFLGESSQKVKPDLSFNSLKEFSEYLKGIIWLVMVNVLFQ